MPSQFNEINGLRRSTQRIVPSFAAKATATILDHTATHPIRMQTVFCQYGGLLAKATDSAVF
jgi:hypothetical protein